MTHIAPMIYFTNEQDKHPVTYKLKMLLRRAVDATIEHEQYSNPCEVSITLTDNEQIHALNRRYREVDRPTDVLSFPMMDFSGESDEPVADEPIVSLGDIVICPSVIFRQAQTFQTTYCQEMCLMVIHSTLHLLGWDHEDEEEKEKMFGLQEEILASQNLGTVKTEG